MGKILSKCCCCGLEVTDKIKKELKREKEVEVIYKQITGRQVDTSFPVDLEIAYI